MPFAFSKPLRMACLGILLACVNSSVIFAIDLEAKCDLIWKSYSLATGNTSMEKKANAEVYRNDCQWFIRVSGNDVTPQEDYWEIGTDCQRVYELHSAERYFTELKLSGRTNLANPWIATISPGPVPPTGPGNQQASVIWMAFFSDYYLGLITNQYVLPLYYPDNVQKIKMIDSGQYRQRASWERFSSPPELTKKVIFYQDYIALEDTVGGVSQVGGEQGQLVRFTNAIYECTASTNIEGLTLPTEFSFTMFATVKRGTNIIQIPKMALYGQTGRIVPHCSIKTFLPRIPGPMNVSDKRFSREGGPRSVVYAVNGNWLGDEEVRTSYAFKTKLTDERRVAKLLHGKEKHRLFFSVVVGCFLAATLALISYSLLKERRKKQKNPL